VAKPKPKAEKVRLTPQEELAKLENDERLDTLLQKWRLVALKQAHHILFCLLVFGVVVQRNAQRFHQLVKKVAKPKPKAEKVRLTPQEELAKLENDERLDTLPLKQAHHILFCLLVFGVVVQRNAQRFHQLVNAIQAKPCPKRKWRSQNPKPKKCA
jgi:hypothetical protein